jgi:hypothetical protein
MDRWYCSLFRIDFFLNNTNLLQFIVFVSREPWGMFSNMATLVVSVTRLSRTGDVGVFIQANISVVITKPFSVSISPLIVSAVPFQIQ